MFNSTRSKIAASLPKVTFEKFSTQIRPFVNETFFYRPECAIHMGMVFEHLYVMFEGMAWMITAEDIRIADIAVHCLRIPGYAEFCTHEPNDAIVSIN